MGLAGEGSFLCPCCHLNSGGGGRDSGLQMARVSIVDRIRPNLYNALYITTLIDITISTVYAIFIMKVVYFINKHISFGSLEAKKVVIKSHLVHFSFAIFTLLAVREVDPDPK